MPQHPGLEIKYSVKQLHIKSIATMHSNSVVHMVMVPTLINGQKKLKNILHSPTLQRKQIGLSSKV